MATVMPRPPEPVPFAWRKLICAWCGELIKREKDYGESEDYESHGICKLCARIEFGKAFD